MIGTVANSVEDSIVAGDCIVPKELQVACVGGKWSGEGGEGKSAKKRTTPSNANGGVKRRCYDLYLTYPDSRKVNLYAVPDLHSPWFVRYGVAGDF